MTTIAIYDASNKECLVFCANDVRHAKIILLHVIREEKFLEDGSSMDTGLVTGIRTANDPTGKFFRELAPFSTLLLDRLDDIPAYTRQEYERLRALASNPLGKEWERLVLNGVPEAVIIGPG